MDTFRDLCLKWKLDPLLLSLSFFLVSREHYVNMFNAFFIFMVLVTLNSFLRDRGIFLKLNEFHSDGVFHLIPWLLQGLETSFFILNESKDSRPANSVKWS